VSNAAKRPKSALALRVAPLFSLNCVASQSSRNGGTDMLPRRALPKPKIDQPRDLLLFTRWLGFVENLPTQFARFSTKQDGV
jgi:hypothetical protein